MRFIGYIKHGDHLIARASENSTADDIAEAVAARAVEGMLRDMRRNNSDMVDPTTPQQHAMIKKFDILNQQFSECIIKTMQHGKDALVTVAVRNDDIYMYQGAWTIHFPEGDTDMVLHFQAKSDTTVLEEERTLDALLMKKT